MMWRKLVAATVAAVAVCTVHATPSSAHDDSHPETMQAILPGQMAGVIGDNTLDVAPTHYAPEYALNCRARIRASGTSADAICFNWSGSGSRAYWVNVRLFDGCRNYLWARGNTAYVGYTSSYYYVPPGTWRVVWAGVGVQDP